MKMPAGLGVRLTPGADHSRLLVRGQHNSKQTEPTGDDRGDPGAPQSSSAVAERPQRSVVWPAAPA
eukprot:CAMPEP_0204327554 /NCGR_PEP_ID=MMETSP0469-20131031/12678_1 /ASSEMBLY_ACC=CAM_ASM_000384 /TAXON_ID=2969 /ORGANISM="Oxyrrhis marina" /LENGTH=65 /DNA_ID=CAMNT_0051309801 /DNA_START=124 /DNA_END=319 /DNA_ORIENTATION=-